MNAKELREAALSARESRKKAGIEYDSIQVRIDDILALTEEPEYEYAVRDESPTSYYGMIYGVGCTEEHAKYLATGRGHNDTAVRRRKAGEWEEVR